MLDRTKDILDYSFVYKHFSRKWSHKYHDITEKNIKPLKEADIRDYN